MFVNLLLIHFMYFSDPETVVMLSSAITNGAIAVDWVNNDIYWVERVQSQAGSTVCLPCFAILSTCT